MFSSYWASGDAANHHLNPYAPQPLTWIIRIKGEEAHPITDLNLNPPFLLPLFQAIALFPLRAGFAVWTFASFLLFAATTASILWLTPSMSEASILCLTLGMPIVLTQGIGQIYGLLFGLGTVAWMALKSGNKVTAAVAIGLLIAIKPILIVWPIFLLLTGERRIALLSSAVPAASIAVPLALHGFPVFAQYAAAMQGDIHYLHPYNISLPAVAARLGIPAVGILAAALLLATLLLYVWRTRPDPCTTTGIAVTAALLCSPLAWVHYTLILFPALATEPESRLKSPAVILLSAPMFFAILLTGAHDYRAILANFIFFAPCCLLLAMFLKAASQQRRPKATVEIGRPILPAFPLAEAD